jgi:hypothetical protein
MEVVSWFLKHANARSRRPSLSKSAATTEDAPDVSNSTSGLEDHPSSEPQKRVLLIV